MATSTVKTKRGRPSKYNAQLARTICARMAEGEPLTAICAAPALPERGTVYDWLVVHPEFQLMYARARELQADAVFDEIAQLECSLLTPETNMTTVAAVRVIIDARKWRLARMHRKYTEAAPTPEAARNLKTYAIREASPEAWGQGTP